MPDSYIQLPLDGTGKKLDADQLTVGVETVYRERDRIAGTAATELADVKNTDPTASAYGVVVRTIDVVSPVRNVLSSASLAAGASVNLDAAIIASGKTAKLRPSRIDNARSISDRSARWQIGVAQRSEYRWHPGTFSIPY